VRTTKIAAIENIDTVSSCLPFYVNVTASSTTTPQQERDERTSEKSERSASDYGFNTNPEIIKEQRYELLRLLH